MTHPPEVGGVGVEGGGDGAFERDGSVGVEQLDESAGEDAEVVVALGGGDEQGLGRRGGVVEAVGGAVLAGEAFAAHELFDVGGVFDLLAPVEGAAMSGKHGAGVEDAHGVQRGRDDEGATDVTMGDGVHRFVSEPQRDHRAVDACLKKVHGRGVSPMSFKR